MYFLELILKKMQLFRLPLLPLNGVSVCLSTFSWEFHVFFLVQARPSLNSSLSARLTRARTPGLGPEWLYTNLKQTNKQSVVKQAWFLLFLSFLL